jgi:hypothetical protein
MRIVHPLGRRAVFLSTVLWGIVGCGQDKDLSRALDGGVGREIESDPPHVQTTAWRDVSAPPPQDTVVLYPNSVCWKDGELLVGDMGRQRIHIFDAAGRHLRSVGKQGAGPGEFHRIHSVRCAPGDQGFLVADAGSMRVHFFDGRERFVHSVDAPPTPQGIPFLGEFGIGSRGNWYDSWLSASVGPYLSSPEWDGVQLVRRWNGDGSSAGGFGTVFEYEDPTVRRVFNRVFFAFHRDTLWVLSQANAVVRGFADDSETASVHLPIYHRGAEPVVEQGAGKSPGYRRNRASYQPNVGGVAVVQDSLFAIVRYRDWRTVKIARRRGENYTDYWPSSSIEIVDRRGQVRLALAAPGRVTHLASDGQDHMAIVSEDLETGHVAVFVGRVDDSRTTGNTDAVRTLITTR